MYDTNNILIYVGKAKNIKKRLQSYTKTQDISPKTQILVKNIASIQIEITSNEKEALLLEASLIKQHQPKYNILLKDDKSRQYIKLSNHKFPAITRYRGKFEKKSMLFGPFGYIQGSQLSTSEIIKYITTFVNKVFKIRSCKDSKFNIHKACGKPCMEFQIKTCSGPCANMISHNAYTNSIEEAKKFLQGTNTSIYKNIKDKIQNLAQNEQFIEADILKNQILAIEKLKSANIDINFSKFDSIDIIAIDTKLTKIEVFSVRNGYALGGNIFEIQKHDGTISEILEQFMLEHYSLENPPAKQILLNHSINSSNIKIIFSELFHTKSEILNPKQGEKKALVDFVITNLEFQSDFQSKIDDKFINGMKLIAKHFNLTYIPNHVEIYDNSHTSGSFFVGSFVVASQKGFETKYYRKFNAKFTKGGDDYGMMQEVMQRRFSKNSKITTIPDLLIIDGGIGQFNVVNSTLNTMNINIPVISIAKGANRNAGNETFFSKEKPEGFKLNDNQLLYFIENLRDEAHRFAISSHRKRREKI